MNAYELLTALETLRDNGTNLATLPVVLGLRHPDYQGPDVFESCDHVQVGTTWRWQGLYLYEDGVKTFE